MPVSIIFSPFYEIGLAKIRWMRYDKYTTISLESKLIRKIKKGGFSNAD
ncbi:hypothetical protein BRYFOR_07288 [Marvinbryantia formatexigens DSM 14469]|uniref:Uncharacterized protein n=1 Tax=Marvinbryantia formatexigens DSM 14469 TaxID=478749 RepID=C6LF85_9FIRM|nr:hypothetical protein BRYFOR_07288 [Marvinbryantia formatexigens DSM 14469]